VRGGVTAVATRRAAEEWTLTCMYVAGGLSCLLAARFPMSPAAPVQLDLTVAALALLAASVVWFAAAHLGRPLLYGVLMLGLVLTSLLVANAATTQGVTVTAFAYVWQSIHVAHFFSRREAWLHTALVAVGYGAALLVNDLPVSLVAYVIVVGTIAGAVSVLSNLVARMREQADTDQLTGLLNRAGFRIAAEREHALATRTRLPLTLAVIDLDSFKSVNDRGGHAAGDRVLRELAAGWLTALRSCDTVGRHGGDEFVLLLPGTTAEGAAVVLERLRSASPIDWSAGIAEWAPLEAMDECLARADDALYEEKSVRRLELGDLVPRSRSRSSALDRAGGDR
jgi:diguanylate cyclase (GGDEF)-like protein